MKKIFFPALLGLLSCNSEKIEEYSVNPMQIDLIEENQVILAGVSSMDYQNREFLITETDYNRFYLLQDDFQALDELGETDSPDFPSYPADANYFGDDIWIYSSELNSIKGFDGSKVFESVLVDSDTQLKNFDIDNNQILFSRVSFEGKPFVWYDLITNEKEYFGEYFADKRTPFFNHYFLDSYSFFIDSGYLFVLPYVGIIRKYNRSFELTEEFDLMDQTGFAQARDWLELQYQSSDNSLISMFTDCQVVEDKLFVLAYDRTPGLSVNPRYVYEIDFSNELELKAKHTLGSRDDYFTKFTHVEGRRFAFFEYQTSSIQHFELPK